MMIKKGDIRSVASASGFVGIFQMNLYVLNLNFCND